MKRVHKNVIPILPVFLDSSANSAPPSPTRPAEDVEENQIYDPAYDTVFQDSGLNFGDANVEALTCGNMGPIIKQELKYTILRRRMLSGEGGISVGTSCTSSNGGSVSDNSDGESMEEDKYTEIRRKRNKEAAQKCRQKKKKLSQSLLEETQSLESQNTTLKYDIRCLEKEKDELTRILQQHLNSQQCFHTDDV